MPPTSPPQRSSRYSHSQLYMNKDAQKVLLHNVAVNLLDSGFFGFALGAASVSTILPLFVSQLTNSALLIALIPSIHLLGWHLPQLLSVQHVAQLQRYLPFVLRMTLHKRLPFGGLALVALLLPYLGPRLGLALTFVLLTWQSFGGGLTATAWQSMLAKLIPTERRGLFFGMHFAVTSLGGALAATAAGWLLVTLPDPLNFSLVFALAFLAMTIAWLCLTKIDEEEHEVVPRPVMPLRTWIPKLIVILRSDSNFVWYLLSRGVLHLGLMGSAFYSVYAVQYHAVTELSIGFYTSVMLITQMLFNPLVGWMGDRWGHRLVMAVGAITLALSALLAFAAPSGEWFALVFLLAGLGNVTYWAPSIAIVLDFAPPHRRHLYIGLANTLIAPAVIAAPFLGSWLVDNIGYEAVFSTSMLGALAAGILLFTVVRDPRFEQEASPIATEQAIL